ncbi:hypothetical protein H4219_004451 [Mycoemilia scoparia]|uniref:SAM-dependent MTase RsmB/NOP-type domain-containing protein n=1 Tax=Mycoemilia scoparia TaxID=417184 RepID=A0A9W8DRU9_9FUNG|nr:hypothetical protein H4219_004451 [Mycoemilia scoparia]
MDAFYKQAGVILNSLARRDGSVKTMTIGNSRVKPEWKRKMYALICETLKYSQVLVEIINKEGLLEKSEKADIYTLLPLVHDILMARGGLQHSVGGGGRSEVVKLVISMKSQLRSSLGEIMERQGVKAKKELIPLHLRDENQMHRYVRINLAKTTKEKVVEYFQNEGYRLFNSSPVGEPKPPKLFSKSKTFVLDSHLPDLLVFPPLTDLHDHPLYLNGDIILQDKASCFPAHVVSPAPNSKALDACAAPGNKTSHMSSLMGNTGTVYAFDMDMKRLDLLKTLTAKAGCTNIVAKCQNFLDVDPLDPQYKDVEYLLLDPSCSGSGIINRMDSLVDHFALCVGHDSAVKGANKEQRLENLSDFQVKIIMHAMKFPSAKRISYSTCSIHKEENEHVVAKVLGQQDRFLLAQRKDVLPGWPRRGLETPLLTKEQSDSVIRASPEDGMNGFFVSCFVVDPSASPIPVEAKDGNIDETTSIESATNVPDDKIKQIRGTKREIDSKPPSSNASKKRKRTKKKRPKQITA